MLFVDSFAVGPPGNHPTGDLRQTADPPQLNIDNLSLPPSRLACLACLACRPLSIDQVPNQRKLRRVSPSPPLPGRPLLPTAPPTFGPFPPIAGREASGSGFGRDSAQHHSLATAGVADDLS